MIARTFAAWIEGMSNAIIWAESHFRHPRHFRLNTTSQPLTLYSLEDPSARKKSASISTSRFDDLPPDVAQETRGGIIEIVVPAQAILERQLEPLPAESLSYAEQVVQHRLESIFPWRAADILHSTFIQHQADGKLDITVRATARSAIEPALSAATACGADEILIVADTGDSAQDRDHAVVASFGQGKTGRINRARTIARYAAFGLILFTVFVVGWTSFANFTIAADIDGLDQAITDRRAIMKRRGDANEATRSLGLEAKKRLAPVVVEVLEKLSSVLPDNTYLTDLSLEAGQLRISGVSADAAGLVPLLEGSGFFKNALFYAPTTRVADTTDRFSIEAVVVVVPKARAPK